MGDTTIRCQSQGYRQATSCVGARCVPQPPIARLARQEVAPRPATPDPAAPFVGATSSAAARMRGDSTPSPPPVLPCPVRGGSLLARDRVLWWWQHLLTGKYVREAVA
ncbi:unnamed protein product [Danaus chrysippus]|uniref:(African queen) hypothetical protein n=1 Tax=Danaus chrysippus TaxID=151541 RepID=A0A8J2RA57_9NEOP|nr:unnamed protein product [Danaus chrysippus]